MSEVSTLIVEPGRAADSRARRRWPVPLIMTALVAVVLIRKAWLCDDAYITFRTADNFVNGYGLRWNLSERVQSYTHPLWLFLFSGVYFFTREPYYTGIWLSIVLSLGAVFLYGWRLAATPMLAVFGVVALASSRAFVDYSTSGLENALTHLLLVIFLILLWSNTASDRRRFLLFLVASLAIVNRIDVALIVGPALLVEMHAAFKSRRTWPVIAGTMPFVLWEAFSLVYYGAPFPNTAYAKLNTDVSRWTLTILGANYYKDSLKTDPTTILVIWAGLLVAMRDPARRALPIGVMLYGVYLLWIGGDFMTGRFFAAPLLIAVAMLTRNPWPLPWLAPASAALTIVISVISIRPATVLTGPTYGQSMTVRELLNNTNTGVAEERAVYYPTTGLLRATPEVRSVQKHQWAWLGTELRRLSVPVGIYPYVGFMGFFAGPTVHIIDCNALTDPLLARLPVDDLWRIGHFTRRIPTGYTRTIAEGRNLIEDPELAKYYDHLSLVVSGPLWRADRLLAILKLNTGGYSHLLNGNPTEPTICDISPPGTS